ncbi:MAG: L-aspartate 1-decarboxylase [Rickettsiaceae bacterium]|jgi:aspartate 1-decarboxylase|nr:L-aspartate 1-decarboxylase [Rickettsiaceae bacterium]
MQLTLMKAKIHRATITEADLHYEGSISIDEDLLDAAGILPYEKVDVLDVNNGTRFSTYTIAAERGSGAIKVNGAAARMVYKGDIVIIVAYCGLDAKEAAKFKPKVVAVDAKNRLTLGSSI